jgi:hypothetical protein
MDCTGRAALVGLGFFFVGLQLSGCATAPDSEDASRAARTEAPHLVDAYGITIEGLRLSAAGSMLDLRYRVLDADKAAPLLNGKTQLFLLDEARNARLGVPNTPTLGRIRQTARNNVIYTDRSYFVMFGNPGKAIQSGDTVALLMGQIRITDLTVQ